MGRPKTELKAGDRRKALTLEQHPQWLTYDDVQQLLRLYIGMGIGRPKWNLLVAKRLIPAYRDPWSNRTRYKWEEVRAAVDEAMSKGKI